MDEPTRRVDRRTVLAGAGAGMIGLAGCQGGPGGGGGDGGDGDLTVTGVWSGAEEESFLEVVSYVEDQMDIEISYDPRDTEAILTGTLMDYEAGVATADIVVIPSPARVRSDARSDHLEPLSDVWDTANLAPNPDSVTVDGEQYAAPFKMDLKPGFWYRNSFFEDNDLEEPGSYDEFMGLLDEIREIDGVDAPLASGNGTGWPLSDVTEAYFQRQENGAELQRNLISGETSMTDDRVIAALEEIQRLIVEGYFSEVRDFGVQFEYLWDNRIPLYFQGSFTTGFDAIQDPSDLGVFRLPGTESMVAAENWFTVPAYVDDPDQATAAVEQFISADAQEIWAERGGFIASNTDVSLDAYGLEVMRTLAEQSGEVELVPDLDDTLGDPFQSEFWSQLTGLWADPEQDVTAIAETLAEVQQEAASEGN